MQLSTFGIGLIIMNLVYMSSLFLLKDAPTLREMFLFIFLCSGWTVMFIFLVYTDKPIIYNLAKETLIC